MVKDMDLTVSKRDPASISRPRRTAIAYLDAVSEP